MMRRALQSAAATMLVAVCLGAADDALQLKGLTRAQVIAELGQPNQVGDGYSLDKGALAYDTSEGRLTIYFAKDSDVVVFWYPGDMRKGALQKAASPYKAPPKASSELQSPSRGGTGAQPQAQSPQDPKYPYKSLEEAFNDGVTHENAGRTYKALKSFSQALLFDNHHAETLLHIGQNFLQVRGPGDGTTARLMLQRALTSGKQSPHGPLSPDRANLAERLLAQAKALEAAQAGTGNSAATISTSNRGGCQDTLAYLSDRLPTVANPDLTNLRDKILSSRISEVAAAMTAQGIPLAQAASLILQQAQDNQKTLDGAKACAVESFDGSGTALASALERRQYDLPLATRSGSRMTIREMAAGAGPSNINRSCLIAFVAADMSKIATDETAVQLTCRATRRP